VISCQRNIQIAFKTSTVYYQPQAKLDMEGWKKERQIIFLLCNYTIVICGRGRKTGQYCFSFTGE